jgi:hypothetical protein
MINEVMVPRNSMLKRTAKQFVLICVQPVIRERERACVLQLLRRRKLLREGAAKVGRSEAGAVGAAAATAVGWGWVEVRIVVEGGRAVLAVRGVGCGNWVLVADARATEAGVHRRWVGGGLASLDWKVATQSDVSKMFRGVDKATNYTRANTANNKRAKKILECTWNRTLEESTKPTSKHATKHAKNRGIV